MVLDLNFNFLALKKDVMSTKMYTMRLLFKQNTDYVMFLATLYKHIVIALTLSKPVMLKARTFRAVRQASLRD